MINPIRVSEGVYRGARPITAEDWRCLCDLGIGTVLDLQSGTTNPPLAEALYADSFRIRVYASPLGWFFPPNRSELRATFSCIQLHKPIYVHCKAGVDRTGMVIAFYKMLTYVPRGRAILDMKQAGMHWWYYWWAWFL